MCKCVSLHTHNGSICDLPTCWNMQMCPAPYKLSTWPHRNLTYTDMFGLPSCNQHVATHWNDYTITWDRSGRAGWQLQCRMQTDSWPQPHLCGHWCQSLLLHPSKACGHSNIAGIMTSWWIERNLFRRFVVFGGQPSIRLPTATASTPTSVSLKPGLGTASNGSGVQISLDVKGKCSKKAFRKVFIGFHWLIPAFPIRHLNTSAKENSTQSTYWVADLMLSQFTFISLASCSPSFCRKFHS